jgi:hypothetical protein
MVKFKKPFSSFRRVKNDERTLKQMWADALRDPVYIAIWAALLTTWVYLIIT